MTTTSPQEAAKLVIQSNRRWETANAKRQPFVDAGWDVFKTDVYTHIGEVRVSADYIEHDNQFELFVFSKPSVIERFDTAEEALAWFDKLKNALSTTAS